jgi:multimeric flavodoxin WrbA
MKAIALVGSPRKGGNTDILTDEFLRGAGDAGAQVEKVYLDDLTIRPIAEVGDVLAERVDLRADDDFPALLQKVLAAEILVIASPVYWQGVTAQMKCFVDRWSTCFRRESFQQGMSGKGFAVLCPFGAKDPAHGEWVTRPVKEWAKVLKANYLGDVCVCAHQKGAVRQMPDALRRAYDLGRRAVEQTHPKARQQP